MIDLTTLEKLKTANKALDICRLELCKPMNSKRLNFSRLYKQHQTGWSIVREILEAADPAYIKRKMRKEKGKRDRARDRLIKKQEKIKGAGV